MLDTEVERSFVVPRARTPWPIVRDFGALPSVAESRRLLGALNAMAGGLGPVPIDRPLVLYGAGDLGKLARSHLDLVGVPIELVVDANADAIRDSVPWQGLAVVKPADVPRALKLDALLAIAIVTSRFGPLHADLTDAGWRRCVPFYDVAEGFRDSHPLSNGWFSDTLDDDDLGNCRQVLDGWSDDQSRAHYLRFAAWRLCRQDWDFAGASVNPSNRFFIAEILAVLDRNERVLDVGAHHGSYLARLLETPGALVSKAWAIEPDPDNRATLETWTRSLGGDLHDRIEIHDVVVGAGSETVRFHEGLGYASQIAASGRSTRQTCSIDSMNLDPTIIKLHVEGAELKALEGASATLARCRPIIMATIYHNDDGLAQTPLWLMRNMPNYCFFMRSHSWCGTGAVVYAVPRERTAPASISSNKLGG